MKIAFTYGPLMLGGRHIDFASVESSPRGLTGSEGSWYELAQEMARRRHQVEMFVAQPVPPGTSVGGALVRNLAEFAAACRATPYDAVCAWNEPDVLRPVPATTVRLCNQQLNDFDYCHAGFHEAVDVFTSPSPNHLKFIAPKSGMLAERWRVLPNGVDHAKFRPGEKVSGRVIWTSSADRGLHWLLQCWPEVKRRAPHASLRCYYNFPALQYESFELGYEPSLLECAQRVRYIRHALHRLAHLDVKHEGSQSREAMVKVLAGAEVFAYPCETVRYSEGFSTATLEACASGAAPVIYGCDALAEIYAAVEPVKVGDLRAFTDELVKLLADAEHRTARAAAALELSRAYSWQRVCDQLEAVVAEQLALKYPAEAVTAVTSAASVAETAQSAAE